MKQKKNCIKKNNYKKTIKNRKYSKKMIIKIKKMIQQMKINVMKLLNLVVLNQIKYQQTNRIILDRMTNLKMRDKMNKNKIKQNL